MRILVVGNGGREHALAWRLAQSARATEIFVAPGNAGTRLVGTNVDVVDVKGLADFAEERHVDLTIVGPEKPLVLGIVDRFRERGLAVVGPTASAARLEGSKAFAKAFMQRHGVPTAEYRTFAAGRFAEAMAYVEEQGAPIVVKASGLAGGKGAIVCERVDEARRAVASILQDRDFGSAGDEVVIESFMQGEEASVFALTDGTDYLLLSSAQDHKRIGEGDTGPNTGGMGAYAPAPLVTDDLLDRVCADVIEPTLRGMASEGYPYTGVLYCGLMISEDGPRVVEFNCRLGDPEAQVVLPLLADDAVDVFEAVAQHGGLRRWDAKRRGTSAASPAEGAESRPAGGSAGMGPAAEGPGAHGHLRMAAAPHPGAAACIVLAAAGYPGAYETGSVIDGLEVTPRNVLVFHAGTKLDENGRVVTAGGRVLGVTALGDDLEDAIHRAYAAVGRISFRGMQFRRDIGHQGLPVRR